MKTYKPPSTSILTKSQIHEKSTNLREILESKEWRNSKSRLKYTRGSLDSGKPHVGDLEGVNILWITGDNPTSKATFLDSVITSLVFSSSPKEVQFLLLGGKENEFQEYGKLPHCMAPVISESKTALSAIEFLIREKDERSRRNIENEPDIVCILGNLSVSNPNHPFKIIKSIGRLQAGEGQGIHFILTMSFLEEHISDRTLRLYILICLKVVVTQSKGDRIFWKTLATDEFTCKSSGKRKLEEKCRQKGELTHANPMNINSVIKHMEENHLFPDPSELASCLQKIKDIEIPDSEVDVSKVLMKVVKKCRKKNT